MSILKKKQECATGPTFALEKKTLYVTMTLFCNLLNQISCNLVEFVLSLVQLFIQHSRSILVALNHKFHIQCFLTYKIYCFYSCDRWSFGSRPRYEFHQCNRNTLLPLLPAYFPMVPILLVIRHDCKRKRISRKKISASV